jgi:KipI family sensor histidine kinase inhibitor
VRPLGDGAALLDVAGHRQAQALAAALGREQVCLRDVVPAADTVGLVGQGTSSWHEVAAAASASLRVGEAGSRGDATEEEGGRRRREVPVCFDGEDIDEVAGLAGISREDLVRLLAGTELEVAFLGFMPGFPYLVGLPDQLAALPRRKTARARVPAGSFALAGGYGGIYPVSSPGGWHLIGRTDVLLFEPDRPPFASFQPGDRLRILPSASVGSSEAARRRLLDGSSLEVLVTGPLLLVEDGGRSGAACLGVPRAGAAVPVLLRAANAALGNDGTAGALEARGGGAVLRALSDLLVVLAGGGTLAVGGREMPRGHVVAVAEGETISLAAPSAGARSVLAVAGGVELDRRFGSVACDAVSGLPPGPLRPGDRLSVGTRRGRPRRLLSLPGTGGEGRAVELRVVEGPDLAEESLSLLSGEWEVTPVSDRTGVRLRRLGGTPARAPGSVVTVSSHAVVPGAVQLMPGGEAVVLGPDCGPVGGYPVAATVIRADESAVGSLQPGTTVTFRAVGSEEAWEALCTLNDAVGRAVKGWHPAGLS